MFNLLHKVVLVLCSFYSLVNFIVQVTELQLMQFMWHKMCP